MFRISLTFEFGKVTEEPETEPPGLRDGSAQVEIAGEDYDYGSRIGFNAPIAASPRAPQRG